MRPQPQLALALVRVAVGAIFAWHGFHKIFELGLGNVTAAYGMAGVPLPLLFAPLVAVLELVGGPLLILGLGARGLAGVLAVMTAGVALAQLISSRPEFSAVEVPLLLLAGSLAVLLGGPGFPALQDRSGAVLAPTSRVPGRRRG